MEEKTKEPETEKVEEKPVTLVESAAQAAERLEKANEVMASNIAKQEELLARQALGGMSESSKPEPVPKLTDIEIAKKVDAGEFNPLKEDGYI